MRAEFCIFESNAPGLKVNFCEPYVDMPTGDGGGGGGGAAPPHVLHAYEGSDEPFVQCIQAKISKTLDKRSTLNFAANCTEQKLSSSESYYLTPNL